MKITSSTYRKAGIGLAVALSALGSPLDAQILEEILVTAQKREQNALRIPRQVCHPFQLKAAT